MLLNPKSFLILLLVVIFGACTYTPRISTRNLDHNRTLAELTTVEIGGYKHWMLARGQDTLNPVLLFVHGGPGAAEMQFLHHFHGALEEYFTIVTWDQRGAGKSNRKYIPDSTLSVSQLLEDVHEMVAYVKKRFNKDKIFIYGHSFGTVLAILEAEAHPEDFYAYISVGHVTDLERNIQLMREAILKKAHDENISDGSKVVGKVDFESGVLHENTFEDVMELRHWIARNGNIFYGASGYWKLGWITFWSPEYNALDMLRSAQAMERTKKTMWNEEGISYTKLFDLAKKVDVPLFFAVGRHDLLTAPSLTKEYCDFVEAPFKEVKMFENSAHCPNFEEPELFNQWLIERVLPLAYEESRNRILAEQTERN